MNSAILSVLLISLSGLCYSADSVVDGTELLLTFLIHRHGDRTPATSDLSYTSNEDELREAFGKYGLGQLTDAGKRRAYQLGQFIRRRYDELLSPNFNKSEIYIRSTDSTRAKMTILTALSAIYPAPVDNWSSDINWTPVPYTTVPAKYDFNLAYLNCPNYLAASEDSDTTALWVEQYADLLDEWSAIIGFNLTASPSTATNLYDIYVCQVSIGIPLDDDIAAIYPQLQEMIDFEWNHMITEEAKAFSAGVLLNQFFTVADQVIAGEDVQRVQIYSAHDLNVLAFETVTRVTETQGAPKFASAYALELRRVVNTGDYVVVPVYLNTPSEDVIKYLEIEECGQRCAYESFRSVTSIYNLDEDEWRTACDFNEDMVIDTSLIG